MPKDQKDIIISILKNTNNYLEFGSGGSTVAASKYIRGRGYSIESEEEWSKKVERETTGIILFDVYSSGKVIKRVNFLR